MAPVSTSNETVSDAMNSAMHGRRRRPLRWLWACTIVLPAIALAAEGDAGKIIVRVLHETAPIRGAIIVAGTTHAVTDVRGEAQLSLPVGSETIQIEREGFGPLSVELQILASGNPPVVAQLQEQSLESQVVIVTATRSGTVVGDQPIRVEAVPEEEIEENLTIQPGNVSTLLNELAGVRMESTAPGLGGAALQMRGMPGRLTQVLSDGLPLAGAESGAFVGR